MTIRVDDGDEIWLKNLPDTGGWSTHRWRQCATLQLTAGKRSLTWTNRKGGGINLNALALCSDPGWVPAGIEPPATAEGTHLLIVQAQKYAEAKAAN